eukprot:8765537-Pyramimonas_sp.AAC.1
MGAAAQRARNAIILKRHNCSLAKYLMVRGMARAAFRRDCGLALLLHRSHPLCLEHLCLDRNS